MDKNVVYREVTTTIDGGGNITEEVRRQKLRVEREPNFIKLYLADLLYIRDLPAGLSGILLALLQRMSYKNDIVINSAIKREIAETTNVKFATVNKAITQFVKGELLIRKDRGLYLFNPHLFARGDWSDIQEIRATIRWNNTGRSIMEVVMGTEVIEEQEAE